MALPARNVEEVTGLIKRLEDEAQMRNLMLSGRKGILSVQQQEVDQHKENFLKHASTSMNLTPPSIMDDASPSTKRRQKVGRNSARRNCTTFPSLDVTDQSSDQSDDVPEEESVMERSSLPVFDDPDAKEVSYRPSSGSKRKSKSRLSRMNTCSIDLSDDTVQPRHSEDLFDIEDPHVKRVSRTSSFTSGDLPRLFKLEEFEEREVLGSGAYGRAVKMRHIGFNRFYVIKELLEHRKASEENLLQEISVLKNLHHPNVLRCVGVVLRDKCLGIVTEFIEGGSLYVLIHGSQAAAISWKRRLHYARDIANGMRYLHRQSIIHRDLNSYNCFIRENDSLVVADFGLAKIVLEHCKEGSSNSNADGNKSHEHRRKHTVVGNPYWMAPEMLSHGTYGFSADVYSFGLILCELIAAVDTDPNFLPRLIKNLSLDVDSYVKMVPADCPERFLELNLACSRLNPDERPGFSSCLSQLEHLCMRVEANSPLPRLPLEEERR